MGRLLEAWLATNHWLRSIESYSFLWQLTLVSVNHALSNSFGNLSLVVKKIVVVEVVKMIQVNYGKGVFFSVVGLVKVRKISDLKRCAILDSRKKNCNPSVFRWSGNCDLQIAGSNALAMNSYKFAGAGQFS